MEFAPGTSQGTIRGSSQHHQHHQYGATSAGTGSQSHSNSGLNMSINHGSSSQATSSTLTTSSTTTAYTFPSGGFNTMLDFSLPPSPRSGALPSPPDSPSSESGSQSGSISSFPSVSSSFFFSSRAPSPHRSQQSSSRYSGGAAGTAAAVAASRYNTGSGSSGGSGSRRRRRAAGGTSSSRHHSHSQTYLSSPDENSSASGRNTSDEKELGYGDEFDYGYGDGVTGVYHEDGEGVDLIIPSLTLPPALQQPTPYGQTLGDLSVLIVGPRGRGKTALVNYLVWDNADVVDVDAWEEAENGTVLLASTDWVEERDSHGLEKFEGSRNVSFIETWGYNERDLPDAVIQSVLRKIHEPFRELYDALESVPASPLLHSLLSSANSPLHTAVIFVCSSPPTFRDHTIMTALAAHIPVITISTDPSSFSSLLQTKLSSFKPPSASALRTGLFRSPQTLALLRGEAADRFLRWREAEQALLGSGSTPSRRARAQTVRQARASNGSSGTAAGTGTIRAKHGVSGFELTSDSGSNSNSNRAARFSGNERHVHYRSHTALARDSESSRPTHRKSHSHHRTWDKAQWEAWLSEDVDRRLREAKKNQNQTNTTSSTTRLRGLGIGGMLGGSDHAFMNAATPGVRELLAESKAQHGPVMDPLHLPSVIALSASILSSLRSRAIQSLLRQSTVKPKRTRKSTKSESSKSEAATSQESSELEYDYDSTCNSDYDLSSESPHSRATAFASWLTKWRVELAIVGLVCAGMKLGMLWSYSNEGGVQV